MFTKKGRFRKGYPYKIISFQGKSTFPVSIFPAQHRRGAQRPADFDLNVWPSISMIYPQIPWKSNGPPVFAKVWKMEPKGMVWWIEVDFIDLNWVIFGVPC